MKISNFKKINLLAVSFLVSLLAVSTAVEAASFADNTLIRSKDWQVFMIRQGQRVKIKDLAELRRNFRGQEIINVDDKTLAEIKIKSSNSGPGSVNSKNRGAGGIRPDDSLIRSRDGKIFVTVQGERRHISDLSELRREHAGQVIHNVGDVTLNRFPRVLEDNPERTFDDNSLIRSQRDEIFVIEEDNFKRQIEDLNELRREHLGQAIHDVDDDVIREFELRGRANEPGEDVRGNADENEVRGRGDAADDFVNGVKLRGDGTVDDNSADSGRNRGSDDSSSSGNSSSSGSDSGRGSTSSGRSDD